MPKYQISVEVVPQFLPEQSTPDEDLYVFAYTITITNTGTAPAQLIARHWVIQDSEGPQDDVRGLGVVGQQPLLRPGEHFQYTSGCHLRSETGSMEGSYRFVTEEGDPFDIPIPRFVLDAAQGGALRVLH